MGIHTYAHFVTSGYHGKGRKKFIGYCPEVAMLDMGYKILSDNIGAVAQKHTPPDDKRVWEINEMEMKWYTREGNHTEWFKNLSKTEKKEFDKKWHKLHNELDKKYPYFYNGNQERYSDDMNSNTPFIIIPLKEFRAAVIKDQAKLINEEDGYDLGFRKFDMAIQMCDMFLNKEVWGDEEVRVILWNS